MRNLPLLLIVDDDKDFLEVLATKFKASAFEVVTALASAVSLLMHTLRGNGAQTKT